MKARIVLIAPRQGIVIHSGMDVYNNEDAKKINDFCRQKELEYGEIERIILSMGTVRIMEQGEKIPIPLQPGKGLVIPAGGGCIE
jgi:hypothetical protein